MPRVRPRFSLLTALLLTTIVGLGIVVVQLWREVRPLRTEVRRLRDEMGVLSIDDSAKIHAIQVRTNDRLQWKWRVWIPPQSTCVARFQWGKVPRVGYPKVDYGCRLESGEGLIILSLQKDRNSGEWKTHVECTRGDDIYRTIRETEPWFTWDYKFVDEQGIEFSTDAQDASDRQLLLKRLRVVNKELEATGLDPSKSNEPTPGFIIWLERQ